MLQNKDIRAYTDPEHATHGPGRRGTNEDSDEPRRDSDPPPPEEEINVELDNRGVHGGTGGDSPNSVMDLADDDNKPRGWNGQE